MEIPAHSPRAAGAAAPPKGRDRSRATLARNIAPHQPLPGSYGVDPARLARPPRPKAPFLLKFTMWLVAICIVLGAAGLALHHYRPQWLADIHLVRTPRTHPSSPTTGATQPRKGHSGRPKSGSRGAKIPPESTSLVSIASRTTTTVSLRVNVPGYRVAVSAASTCWVGATAPGLSGYFFTSTLAPGQRVVITPRAGNLELRLGITAVTVTILGKSGTPVPGWSFGPPPYTIDFVPESAG